VNVLSPADPQPGHDAGARVLRCRYGWMYELHTLLKHPNAKLDPAVLIAIANSVHFSCCIWTAFLRAQRLTKAWSWPSRRCQRFASGMVNAVLRKLMLRRGSVAGGDGGGTPRVHGASPVDGAALGQVLWHGDSKGDLPPGGRASLALTVRIANAAVDAELADAGIHVDARGVADRRAPVCFGDVLSSRPYQLGRIRFQDEAVAVVAELALGCGPAVESILDACAAPGGKTLDPCGAVFRGRALLRAKRARSGWTRCASGLRTCRAHECRRCRCDGVLEEESAFADLVLADVPCRRDGNIGPHPEIRNRLRPRGPRPAGGAGSAGCLVRRYALFALADLWFTPPARCSRGTARREKCGGGSRAPDDAPTRL